MHKYEDFILKVKVFEPNHTGAEGHEVGLLEDALDHGVILGSVSIYF